MLATILHADLDAFYASVEQLLDPALRGKPIAVGGGVVLAASYEAKAFGVQGGMPGRRARELCPHLIFVGGHFKEYQRLGDAAIKVLDDFTPLVERISIDEAFADVAGCTHLFGSPAEIAQKIRQRVTSELGLPISVGVARTKHLAKIASQVAKPDGLVVVDPEKRTGVPARPAGRADVGRRPGHQGAAGRAWRHDHRRSWRSTSPHALERLLGPAAGEKLTALAWNRDPREIRTHHRARSAGAQSALGRKPADAAHLSAPPCSSRRPHRHAAARQVAGRPHRDGARALRRPARRHALDDARRADRRDREPGRDRRGAGARRAGRSSRGEAHLAARDLGVASGEAAGLQLELRSALADEERRARHASAAWRAHAPTAPSTRIRDRFGWEAIGYGSVALGLYRSVPDEFRELAEKEL